MEKFRGDTFLFHITIENNGESQSFQIGDIVKFGMKRKTNCNEYALYKEVEITEEQSSVDLIFSSEETSKLKNQVYQVEIELTRNNIVETVYRDTLTVVEDVIKNE